MSFNEQQLRAINSDSRTILVLAGAGAGKSTTMIARICRLIEEGVEPNQILSLTFTNAAALEMKEKYKKQCKKLTTNMPEFRTFHSFCYSLIIKDSNIREKLGYSKIPSICDDNKLNEIKTKVRLQVKCNLSEAKMSGDVPLSSKEKFSLELFNKALKREIIKENLITFDMLCYNVCILFEKDDPCISKYKKQYKYINVDEFQDTDRKQMKFVASFPEDTSIFCVADALQNIYAFRGTTNEYVKTLSEAPIWVYWLLTAGRK